jgi:antitoxin component of MazEF toxin-antitoxin module
MRRSLENTKLRKIGNGQGILLTRSICNLMGIEVGQSFSLDIEGDRLVLIPQESVEK